MSSRGWCFLHQEGGRGLAGGPVATPTLSLGQTTFGAGGGVLAEPLGVGGAGADGVLVDATDRRPVLLGGDLLGALVALADEEFVLVGGELFVLIVVEVGLHVGDLFDLHEAVREATAVQAVLVDAQVGLEEAVVREATIGRADGQAGLVAEEFGEDSTELLREREIGPVGGEWVDVVRR